ncbi:MAG: tetratricopeptide repeat protein [Bacteroidales bacterium]|nr:tetratricopeptide repeat protein [Bacteroidales bacterium]
MKKLLLSLTGLLIFCVPYCQNTAWHTNSDATFRQAKDLYDKEKYNTAQKLFIEVFEQDKNSQTMLKPLSQFYIAQCAVRLFNADAEFYTMQFINDNPDNNLVNEAWFSLGGYFYTLKKWNDALSAYLKTDWRKLNKEQQSEYFFKKGYCYFMKDNNNDAKLCFYEIKDKNTKFTSPALYYYSHIHYTEENYQTALNGFLKLTGDKTFGPIVPYYVVQIYYMQGKFEEIVGFVPGIIDNVTEQRIDEVARIAAEAFFKLERYSGSIEFFRKYMQVVSAPAPEATYQYAYSLYKTSQFDTAALYFQKISHEKGALGQNASYYLGSCYLKQGDKENARKAFASASRSDFDQAIKQDAMFNYALLTYEIGGDPFTDAIRAFEDFIAQYPGSKRIDEARRLLIQAYLGARNYKQALASIDKIENKNDELKEAYQRIAYNRGVELFNNLDFTGAAEMFRNSLKYKGYDAQREARSWFWLGESLYRSKKYNEAVQAYTSFKAAPVAHTVEEFKVVDYNLAYAYYKKENYSDAATLFRQFASSANADVGPSYIADALLRTGDCFFMQTSYLQAVDFYQRAIDANIESKDYALMQKGMSQGLMKKELDKIGTMKQIAQAYPASVYADNAWYEMAQEYLKLQDSKQAIEALISMYGKYPNSELAAKALVQLGLLHFNADNNQAAIEYYKKAVSGYPGTQEAKDALFGLKNIYIDMGKIEDYSAFVDGMQGNVPRLTVNEKDSLTYVAAEKLYMSSDCAGAKPAFARYLSSFPDGAYVVNAHFYKGDCHYQAREYAEARQMFDFVTTQPRSLFTEQAYLGNARIAVSLKEQEKAIESYKGLLVNTSSASNIREAKTGIMRAQYSLQRFSDALQSAEEVLAFAGLAEETIREASFIKARCLQQSGREMLALEEYRKLSVEVLSPQGAESKFRVAEILVNQNKADEAEKEILDFSGKSTSHDYWIARSFILWSDIFVARKNYFQSIETLQSIIDYYANSNDGIIEMAREKKAATELLSKSETPKSIQEQEEINIEKK